MACVLELKQCIWKQALREPLKAIAIIPIQILFQVDFFKEFISNKCFRLKLLKVSGEQFNHDVMFVISCKFVIL